MKKHNSSTRTPVMKKMFSAFFAFLSIFMLLPLQPSIVAEAVDYDENVIMEVSTGETKQLIPNHPYYSKNKTYVCIFQSDGNLVVYRYRSWLPKYENQFKKSNAVWASSTGGNLNSKCYLQRDGNLVIYNSRGQWVFSAGHSDPNRKGTTQLCLSNRGLLSLQTRRYAFQDWNRYWTSIDSTSMGHVYRFEPQACKYVGKWVPSGLGKLNQTESSVIIIDFPDDTINDWYDLGTDADKRMNVQFINVKTADAVWPSNCSPYFMTSSFTDVWHPSYDHMITLYLENSYGGIVTTGTKHVLYLDKDADNLYYKSVFHGFSREES